MTHHLGSQLSALVDGQLSPAAADRALAHVAGCAECTQELAAARAARRALAAAMDVPVAPELTARLLALGSTRCGPVADRRPDDRRSVPLPGEGDDRLPGHALRGDVVRRHTGLGILALSGVGVGAAFGVLLVLGEQPEVTPPGHTAHVLTVLGQAATAPPTAEPTAGTVDVAASASGPDLSAPDADAAVLAWLADHGWAAPTALPDGYEVTAVRPGVDGPGSLEVDLVGPERSLFVVTQREGRLDVDAVGAAPVVQMGDHDVRVLSTAPWHGVWQQGDVVVDLVTTRPDVAVELVAAHPVHPYPDGLGGRISRGWTTIAGAWSP